MKGKLKILPILAIVILIFLAGVMASMLIPANDKAKENAKAPDVSPVITETPAGEWELVAPNMRCREKGELAQCEIIHYAKPANPGKNPQTQTCYKLLGVKWKILPVNYIINPTNPQGLEESFITNTISTSAETWDAVTSTELFNNLYTVNYDVQYGVQDYKNAISFGNYPNENVIAVTSIWYTRVGKQIVEFDILFDTDFSWGDATLNPLLMDLQNIATHELGHSAGLNDIYTSICSAVTMYGYSNYGETQKRTLEQPDITGLQKIYGV